jgi:peroxiredoxin
MTHRTSRTRLALSLAALALALVAGHARPALAQGASGPIALGTKTPMADFKMQTTEGKEVSLDSVKGKKGTLVVFTCNTCPFAKGWEERIVAVGNKAADHGVGMIAINSNDPERVEGDAMTAMQDRAKLRGIEYAYAADPTGAVARAFGASHTPEVFLFDAKGKLVYHGAVDDNVDDPKAVKQTYLADAVADLSAGKAMRNAQTKAIGCGIKFRAKTGT